MGRKERERIKALYRVTVALPAPVVVPPSLGLGVPMVVDGQQQPPLPIIAQPLQPTTFTGSSRPHPPVDEIQSERGVMLLPERGGKWYYDFFAISSDGEPIH